MTATEMPGPLTPELVEALDRHTAGLQLDRSAQRLTERLITNASAVVNREPSERRDALVRRLVRQLDGAATEVVAELRGYRVPVVEGALLGEILRRFCPFPPFCFGEDELVIGSGADPAHVLQPR